MKTNVLVVSAEGDEAAGISEMLKPGGYTADIIESLDLLEEVISTNGCMAVLIDLDTIAVSNRAVRQLTLQFPQVCFFCASWKPFHPELKDAICYHIYACIQKPIDPEELLYWMKSIAAQIDDNPSMHPP